jgi:hypothetical protein
MFSSNRTIRRLIALSAIAAAGCQSNDPMQFRHPPSPVMTSGTACQKADSMWNDKIAPSRYEQLPPLTSPGFFDLLRLLSSHFLVKALTAEGDELEEGRRKLIHAFGAEARFQLVMNPSDERGYTGIFKSGAECAIGRFSMASKPTADTSIPALALKIFIGKDQPSVNLHLMNSVDGQSSRNFFAQTFSNIVPAASTATTRLLTSAFARSAEQFGANDPNPGHLTLEHLAEILPNGERVPAPRAPYQLLFKPSAQARALMEKITPDDDFRIKLAGLSVGQVVYDIYAMSEGEAETNARHLGQLVLASPVVSSRFGDEKLFFRHNMERK